MSTALADVAVRRQLLDRVSDASSTSSARIPFTIGRSQSGIASFSTWDISRRSTGTCCTKTYWG